MQNQSFLHKTSLQEEANEDACSQLSKVGNEEHKEHSI